LVNTWLKRLQKLNVNSTPAAESTCHSLRGRWAVASQNGANVLSLQLIRQCKDPILTVFVYVLLLLRLWEEEMEKKRPNLIWCKSVISVE